jgi:hypothetical protein
MTEKIFERFRWNGIGLGMSLLEALGSKIKRVMESTLLKKLSPHMPNSLG